MNIAEPALPESTIDGRNFGRGMAIIRIFFGIILFANGLAKLNHDWARVDIGWWHVNLVSQDGARGILNFEVNNRQIVKDGPKGTEVAGLRHVVNEWIIPHWGFFGPFITWFEVLIGALLILGLVTRLSAMLDLGQQLFLAAVYFSSNRWMFEQPHEYIPLIVLALLPAGRVWGLDGWLIGKRLVKARWPF